MKKFYIILLVSLITPTHSYTAGIPLDSGVISMFDGRLINADTVTMLRAYQSEIKRILTHPNHTFRNSAKSVHEIIRLTTHETYQRTQEDGVQLEKALTNAKNQFITLSEKYRSLAQNTRPVMGPLVAESCKKRNRSDSLLMIWATEQGNEEELFKRVDSLEAFECFCLPLYDFFDDLIATCPKAVAQERQKKINLIKEVCAHMSFTSFDEQTAFVNFIHTHIDKLPLHLITLAKMQEIYRREYKK